MPIRASVLLGFMDAQLAEYYLMNLCVLPNSTPASRAALWQAERAKIGNLQGTPGVPQITDIPARHDGELRRVKKNLRYDQTVRGAKSAAFKLVEIAPLIPFQFHVLEAKTQQRPGGVPTIEQMLPMTLPHHIEDPQAIVHNGPTSLLLKADNLNLRLFGGGLFGREQKDNTFRAGIAVGISSNLVQVGRVGGRCYLKNGYHRAVSLMKSGATKMPALLLDFDTLNGLEAGGPPGTFDTAQLQSSARPPTLADLARATALDLRKVTRVIVLSWAEHAYPEE